MRARHARARALPERSPARHPRPSRLRRTRRARRGRRRRPRRRGARAPGASRRARSRGCAAPARESDWAPTSGRSACAKCEAPGATSERRKSSGCPSQPRRQPRRCPSEDSPVRVPRIQRKLGKHVSGVLSHRAQSRGPLSTCPASPCHPWRQRAIHCHSGGVDVADISGGVGRGLKTEGQWA